MVDVTALRGQLSVLAARHGDGAHADERAAVSAQVESLLDNAERAARGVEPRRRRLWSWWGGRGIETAFHNLHRAEAEIVRLYDDAEARATVPEAVARIGGALPRDDERRKAALRLLGDQGDFGPAERMVLGRTIQIGHELKDHQFTKIRKFRNVVILLALATTLLVIGFAVVVSLRPDAVSFCFGDRPAVAQHPAQQAAAPAAVPASTVPRCASGGQHPGPMDVWIVALVGLLGGSLSTASGIRKIHGTPSPYNLAVALAFLKAPVGAISAIGGLILLNGGFVPGFSALDTAPQILAYALVFGLAQQLVTGLADKRALDLTTSMPNKDVEQARRPETPLLG